MQLWVFFSNRFWYREEMILTLLKSWVTESEYYWLICQPVPDVSTSSLQLDLHVEGSAPITLLVRDESRSTKSYQPHDSPTSPVSPFLTRKVRSASPHVENEKDTLPTPCGGTCCPRGTIKQVSWGSTSSLTPSPQPAPATPAVSPWVGWCSTWA